MNKSGSEKLGPSQDYLKLLRGEIAAEEYVRRLKATVNARLGLHDHTLSSYVHTLRQWSETPRWRVFRRRYLRRLANDLADIYLDDREWSMFCDRADAYLESVESNAR